MTSKNTLKSFQIHFALNVIPVGGLGSLGLLDVVVVVDGVAAVVVLAVLHLDVVLELLPSALAGRSLYERENLCQ